MNIGRRDMCKGLVALTLSVLAPSFLTLASAEIPEEMGEITRGLFFGEFVPKIKSPIRNSKIVIVRADPNFYDLKLLLGSEVDHQITAHEWVKQYELVCAINAGMYRQDHRTNCGYARSGKHVNNPEWVENYKSVLVVGPMKKKLPVAQIINLDEQNKQIADDYSIAIQNLRTIKHGKNRWGSKGRYWSEASFGLDREGNFLFMFSSAPYRVCDFNENVLALPLNLMEAMHCEGGPEASLSVRVGDFIVDRFGSYETGFYDDSNSRQWPIPNVLGLVKKL